MDKIIYKNIFNPYDHVGYPFIRRIAAAVKTTLLLHHLNSYVIKFSIRYQIILLLRVVVVLPLLFYSTLSVKKKQKNKKIPNYFSLFIDRQMKFLSTTLTKKCAPRHTRSMLMLPNRNRS